MQRRTIDPRANWADEVRAKGLVYCYTGDRPYWDESAYYEFTAEEIDRLEAATRELQRLCLEAGQHIIDRNRFSELGIPETAIAAIRRTWDAEPPAIYGRFDLAYDGRAIKLLEYNADTPTALLESSVIQWYWLEARFPHADQFNSLHERLVAKWRDLRNVLSEAALLRARRSRIRRGSDDGDLPARYGNRSGPQDRDPADGSDVGGMPKGASSTCKNARSELIFKLYPWEWMVHEAFGAHALEAAGPDARSDWIEPIWKMLWSNKGVLAILWELFPGHPNLLPAYLKDPGGMTAYVKKPLMSREGANVSVVTPAGPRRRRATMARRDSCIRIASIPRLDGNRPVLGSWVIDGEPAGIGIRESTDLNDHQHQPFRATPLPSDVTRSAFSDLSHPTHPTHL